MADGLLTLRPLEAATRDVLAALGGTQNLPDELILTNYFTVRNGKIVNLIVIRNTSTQ